MSRLSYLEEQGLYVLYVHHRKVTEVVSKMRVHAIANNHVRPFQSFDLVEKQIDQAIKMFEPEE